MLIHVNRSVASLLARTFACSRMYASPALAWAVDLDQAAAGAPAF